MHVRYSLRVVSELEHHGEAELHLTRGIAERSLVLRELRHDDDDESKTSLLQAVIESDSHSDEALQDLVRELRACPWIESVDIVGTDPEAE